jgi:hypothetical protein
VVVPSVAPAVNPSASTARRSGRLKEKALAPAPAQIAETAVKKISIWIGDHGFEFMFDALKTDFVLFGRSTPTVEAINLSNSKKCHLKFSWQESCRPREAVVIQKAREIGAKGGVLGNLPHLVAHAEFDLASTAKLAEQLGFDKDANEVKGSRTLCILAFDILEPITSLQGKALWKAYWEIIKCAYFLTFFSPIFMCSSSGHYILWKGGVQHGDISVSNLMHRNGTGVLNDFDLARLTTPGNVHPRGFDRTGTTPFLALDLLTEDAQDGKVERRYRHDLESFLWVLMWITTCYDNGVQSIPPDHRRWIAEDTNVCLDAKTRKLQVRIVTTNSYRSLTAVTNALWNYWRAFYNQQQEETEALTVDDDWKQSTNENSDASSSTPVVAIELSEEQVLSNLLHVFASHPTADRIKAADLILPSALFPNYANSSGLSV